MSFNDNLWTGKLEFPTSDHKTFYWEMEEIRNGNNGFFRSVADQQNFLHLEQQIASKKSREELQSQFNVKIPAGDQYHSVVITFWKLGQRDNSNAIFKVKWGYFVVMDYAGVYKLYKLAYSVQKTPGLSNTGLIDPTKTKLIWKRTQNIPEFLKGLVSTRPVEHSQHKIKIGTQITRQPLTLQNIQQDGAAVFSDNEGNLYAMSGSLNITPKDRSKIGQKFTVSGIVKKLVNVGHNLAGLLFRPIVYTDTPSSKEYQARTSRP